MPGGLPARPYLSKTPPPVSEPFAPARAAEGSNAPDSPGAPVFLSRRERRAFEQAQAGAVASEQLSVEQLSDHATAAAPQTSIAVPERDDLVPFAGLLRGSEAHDRVADVRAADARLTDARRVADPDRLRQADPVEVSTQTGRTRLRPDDLARITDSAPVPILLPGPDATLEDHERAAETAASRSKRRTKAVRAAARVASEKARKQASLPRTSAREIRPKSGLSRLIAKAGVMVAAFALMVTMAVPAYAQLETQPWVTTADGRAQTLAVGAVQAGTIDKDDYAAHTTSAALDSTLGTVVAPEVQALAKQLMAAVSAGRLVGSTPDHIFEIRYLAQGEAVPGCGVDYRVLQAIAYALTVFNTVGISDINRHCTGQIEGAGTASAHYTDGGGHAVDFFRLNGQALTGGDANSIKLIEALDAVVPSDANVGQEGCRSSLSLTHFKEIADTCNHVHIDFLDAKGATLLG